MADPTRKILKPTIKATGILDAVEMGVIKTVAEKAFTPVIGNGNIKSGAIKLVAGGVLGSISRNKHVGLGSSAIVMDGTEDIAHGLLAMMGGSLGGAADGNTNDGW